MLDDIVFDSNLNVDFVIEFNRGDIGEVLDIHLDSMTYTDQMIVDVPLIIREFSFAFG